MSVPGFQFTAISPANCGVQELNAFEKLVREGGEVTGAGLTAGIQRAVALVFMTEDGQLRGVAGIKSPASSYRSKVSTDSGIKLSEALLPYELGWVYITKEAQGKKQCRPLVQRALAAANGEGIFATSRQGRDAMHHVLMTEGFVKAGKPYLSANGENEVFLFVRTSSKNPEIVPGDLMKELREAMLRIYTTSLRETGVNHSIFHRMIIEQGPHATAVHLVHLPRPSDGYTDLYLKHRLDLTVEALVLQSKWRPLFADETRKAARKRLTEYRFEFAKFGL